MPSKNSICIFVCVTLLVVQNSVAKSLVPKCDYACKEQDLETGADGFFASGSAISSQFVAPDGSVVTNSKGTIYSSDGIKQTFHELKKEADRFVQTGQGSPNIHSAQLPPFGNVGLPNFQPIQVPYVDSYSSQSTKDHGLEKKIIYSLSPSVNSQYTQVQTQDSAHVHSNPQIICDICASHTGSGHSENTASYNAIVGNVLPISEVHSSYQKSESSSSQKNSSYQTPPIFSSNPKPNTFTTTYIDFSGANKNTINHGAGSESHVNYQEQGGGQIKSEERIQHTYGGGPVAYPSKVVVSVNQPNVMNSHSYEKQSSSQVQTANHPVVFPASALAQQQAELSKQHQSTVFLPARGVSVDLDQHPSSYQSSHSYYSSSSSSSSSKSVSSSDGASPVVVQQNPIKYSASNGYSSSSSSSGSSYSQNIPSEVHADGQKIHGVSSSIYNHEARGDQIQSNPNAETLCTICSPVPIGQPVKKTYGVATSYSSQSSTINGKTTENREAAVEVNDNGKVDTYHVKT